MRLNFGALKILQVSGLVQLLQLGTPRLQQLGQFGRKTLVSSCETDPEREPLIELKQALGLQLCVPHITM